MAIEFNDFTTTAVPNYRKIKGSAFSLSSGLSPSELLEVIVKVNDDNYVPSCVTLRNRLSPVLFTATTQLAELQALDDDPRIDSVSVSEKLRTIG